MECLDYNCCWFCFYDDGEEVPCVGYYTAEDGEDRYVCEKHAEIA